MSGTYDMKKKNINDGFFDIRYDRDGVFLTVYPPALKGKRVETADILEKLGRKKIRNFSRESVETAVTKADKVPVRIAETQEEVKINASASVTVTQDKLKAFLMLTAPEGGRMLTAEEITAILGQNGVIYGINGATLSTIAKYPVYNETVCIAEGTLPVTGQNGTVQFHFDFKKDRKPAILEDGKVDFRELNLIESVRKGQLLCTLVPPMPGINGKTVAGTDIPAMDGKPASLPKGKNVEAAGDGQSLVAAIDGQVSYIDGKVNVFANYEVPADVDNSTGNIYFVGNVCVRGNVLSGFAIEAGGNVEVWGVVEGAVIKAGGDIILRRGIQGLGKGALISGGDIIARYIENSNVEAKNDIKAEAIMHSNVRCGNRVELGGRKGLLVGGTCKAGREVTAKVVGSVMATVTDIEVGVDPALREAYKSLKNELASVETDLHKTEQAITLLRKLETAGMLSPEKQEMLAKSIRTKLFYTNRLMEIQEEIPVLESRLQQEAYGKVRAYNFIYPGVKVTIGSSTLFVKENLQYCTLYRDGADIRVGAIDK